jgi:hypothetical protein
LDATTSVSYLVDLAIGENDVTLSARDRAGNLSDLSFKIRVDDVTLHDYRSLDERIPGARLQVPDALVEHLDPRPEFELSVEDSLTPGLLHSLGGTVRQLSDYGVRITADGSDTFQFNENDPCACARLTIPYDPLLVAAADNWPCPDSVDTRDEAL